MKWQITLMTQQEILIERIKELPPEMYDEVAEILDFVIHRRNLATKKARAEAIAAYAEETAGSIDDLDSDLEAVAIEHLLTTSDK
jgi:hypothetical protein